MWCGTVQLEELVLTFQTHAYHRALVVAHERRSAIETVAEEMLASPDATVSGARVDELLKQPPEAVSEQVLADLPFQSFVPEEVRCLRFGCSAA